MRVMDFDCRNLRIAEVITPDLTLSHNLIKKSAKLAMFGDDHLPRASGFVAINLRFRLYAVRLGITCTTVLVGRRISWLTGFSQPAV
jgi:hypothetical protein